MRHVCCLLLAVSLALASCGGGDDGQPVSGPTERPEPTPVTPTPSPTTPLTTRDLEDLQPPDREIVEAAIADLGDRTGADPEEIALVSFEHVTWSDGSLGCPEPGKMYTQALVDGSRTVLEFDGRTYDYHAGRDGDPFLCEQPRRGGVSDPTLTVPSEEK